MRIARACPCDSSRHWDRHRCVERLERGPSGTEKAVDSSVARRHTLSTTPQPGGVPRPVVGLPRSGVRHARRHRPGVRLVGDRRPALRQVHPRPEEHDTRDLEGDVTATHRCRRPIEPHVWRTDAEVTGTHPCPPGSGGGVVVGHGHDRIAVARRHSLNATRSDGSWARRHRVGGTSRHGASPLSQ